MDEKIEITIKHVTDESDGFAHKLLYVERQINRDGEVVYSDRISPEIMLSSTDPLSEFHNWLYNTGRYRSKVRTSPAPRLRGLSRVASRTSWHGCRTCRSGGL